MFVLQAAAADVNLMTAKSTAVDFLQSNAKGKFQSGAPANSVKLLRAEANSTFAEKTVYYIFTDEQNFVVVAGDDRAPQILAYGDSRLDMNSMPDNMRFWLSTYKEQIEYLQAHPGLMIDPKDYVNNQLNTPNISPLLTAKWAQQEPYYNQCPIYEGSYCVTGCPATSLSMVFHHWKYPTTPIPAVEGYMNPSSEYVFEIPALPSFTFDWDNMLDEYKADSYTTEQADAVAWLMRYVGQVEQLKYTPEGTGGKGEDIIRAVQFFGYDEDAELIYKSKLKVNNDDSLIIADDEWSAMIQKELEEGRPVVYCGYHREWFGWYGHAFNVDGYRNGLFHVNWGAKGNGDGYFRLNVFVPNFGSNYNVEQQMIIGIQPPPTVPTIKAHRSLVYLKTIVGNTATSTFTIKGHELTGDVTLTLNDQSGCFSMDAAIVTNGELANGKVITVSYTPQTDGEHRATITLSCPGAQDKTVTVIGKAMLDTSDPVMLPPDDSAINLTQFRADWTDETPEENVGSYTLKVYTRPDVELIDALDGSNPNTLHDPSAIILSEPWGGSNVSAGPFSGYNTIYFARPLVDDIGFNGYITYTVPAGFNNQVFSVQVSTINQYMGAGKLSVESEQTTAVEYAFSQNETHTWLVTASAGEKITFTSSGLGHSPYMSSIQIYAGDVTQSGGTTADDGISRLIPGITDRYYTVTDLPAAGTYVYKVKAMYLDGTESAWSNRQTVTLFDNGHGFVLGDVNHDSYLTIDDVTALINYLLTDDASHVCLICADVLNDNEINISDVTALIGKLLNSN